MATPETGNKYRELLIGEIAIRLIDTGGKRSPDLDEALCLFHRIGLCECLNQISPEEAKYLTSIISQLCPQVKERTEDKSTSQLSEVEMEVGTG